MKSGYRLVWALAMALLAQQAQAAVQAILDHDRVAMGETVQLTLKKDGQGGEPDLTPLRKDFEVLGQSKGSSFQMINGTTSSSVQVQIALAPRHGGSLVIPVLNWGNEHTQALSLTVDNSAGAAQGAGTSGQAAGAAASVGSKDLFIETELDNPKPYVQSAVHLKVRIYTAQQLVQAGLDFEPSPEVLMQQLGKDKPSDTTRNGRHFSLIERDYLLFPQKSGHIELAGPVLNAQVLKRIAASGDPVADLFAQMPGGVGRAVQAVRLHGDPIRMDVSARPADVHSPYWIPAKALSLSASWQPDSLEVHVGDPLSLHLVLRAEGLTAAQLPDLAPLLSVPDGIKIYPDQARLTDSPQESSVVGERSQNVALLAQRAGRYTLPAVTVQWWDIKQNMLRTERLPEKTIVILPAAAGQTAASHVQDTAPSVGVPAAPSSLSTAAADGVSPWWRVACLLFALLWCTTGVAWCWERCRRGKRLPTPIATSPGAPAQPAQTSSMREAFHAACQAHDPLGARTALIAWSCAHWRRKIAGLGELSTYLDGEAAERVRELDRACYGNGLWHGDRLSAQLRALPDFTPSPNPVLKQIPGLYEL
jgi:hypothetical protein